MKKPQEIYYICIGKKKKGNSLSYAEDIKEHILLLSSAMSNWIRYFAHKIHQIYTHSSAEIHIALSRPKHTINALKLQNIISQIFSYENYPISLLCCCFFFVLFSRSSSSHTEINRKASASANESAAEYRHILYVINGWIGCIAHTF